MKNLKLVIMRQLFVVAMMGVVMVGQAQAKGAKVITSTDQITLNAGWNLISLDVIPNPATPDAVFEPLISNNNLEIVTGFQNQMGVFYDPNSLPFLNSMQNIIPGEGYWVKVMNAATLSVSGEPISEAFSIDLKAGWNLVGYWLPETTTPEAAFAALMTAGVLEMVTSYNQGSQIFDPTALSVLNTLTQIKNGFGYWVKINADYNGFSYPIWECGNVVIDDRDGKTYETVQIGNQCWMKQNLNLGTRIDGANSQTNNATIEKYCYDNLETNCDIYGGLYQWDEMMQYTTVEGVQGLCPDRWYIPSDGDWTLLTGLVGGWEIAGGNLKEIGYSHWSSPNSGATNESGFTAIPGGFKHTNMLFYSQGLVAIFWSSTLGATFYPWTRDLSYNTPNMMWSSSNDKSYGCSVRCIKVN